MDIEDGLAKLRALADPTRMALYDVIGIAGEEGTTAQRLAASVPSARRTMQLDLSELADAGWIAGAAVGEDVVWRLTDQPIRWDPEMLADPRTSILTGELERIVLQRRADRIQEWLGQRGGPEWSQEWVDASISHDYTLHLRPVDLREFERRFVSLIDEFRQPRDRDGGETVLVTLTGIPFRP